MKELYDRIREIPNYPKPGIQFKDITPLLQDADSFKKSVDIIADRFRKSEIELVVGTEARGFILGAAVAYALGVGFIPVRKPGKLPHDTMSVDYELEYGTDSVEMHLDAVSEGQKVLLVDDLLATGGTAAATLDMLTRAGADVLAAAFLVELKFLNGRSRLGNIEIFSILTY
jgi:adenine phosphoribosyltransferase